MTRGGLLLTFAALLFCASPACAALKLCNRTSYVLYVATASTGNNEVLTQGWTRIVPGDCKMAIKNDLTAQRYFAYARSSLAHSGPARAWGGKDSFCVKDANFSLHVPLDATFCPGDDSFFRPFAVLDTHHMRSWTLSFDDEPAETGMETARRDGLKRLLRDNGFAPTDKHALSAMRKRFHLGDDADDAQLFDALETAALKIAAPAGYTACNDSAGLILVALGERTAAAWRARGWWKIAPGGCAKLLDQFPLAANIYLLAEKQNGQTLVGGGGRFCITNIEFEIQGREHCSRRGLIEAGFASTDTRGMRGYVAHIGASGLAPHPSISK